MNSFVDEIKGKRVLFVTTKNIDYIRNTQEVRLLKQHAGKVLEVFSEKNTYLKRILDVWKKVILIDKELIDVFFVGFAPQLILPFFYYRFRNKVIVIDFFISVYDTLIQDRQKFATKGIVAKICHLLDTTTINKADYIITDTQADTEFFVKEFKGNRNKFETLYLEADSRIYYPRECCKKEELENKFVILYFGSVLPLQGVEIILEVIRLLKERKDIYFQIIGPIKGKKPIQENVEYIEWLEQKELADYIANADLCLAGHFNSEIEKAQRTIPGKAYIYSAMQKEMILGDNKANRELFSESDKVVFAEMGNVFSLKNVIIEIVDNRQKK